MKELPYLWYKHQEQSESCAYQYANCHDRKQRLIQLGIPQNRSTDNADDRNSEHIVDSNCDLVGSILHLNLGVLQLPCQEDSDQEQDTFVTTDTDQKLDEVVAIAPDDLLDGDCVCKQIRSSVQGLC